MHSKQGLISSLIYLSKIFQQNNSLQDASDLLKCVEDTVGADAECFPCICEILQLITDIDCSEEQPINGNK